MSRLAVIVLSVLGLRFDGAMLAQQCRQCGGIKILSNAQNIDKQQSYVIVGSLGPNDATQINAARKVIFEKTGIALEPDASRANIKILIVADPDDRDEIRRKSETAGISPDDPIIGMEQSDQRTIPSWSSVRRFDTREGRLQFVYILNARNVTDKENSLYDILLQMFQIDPAH